MYSYNHYNDAEVKWDPIKASWSPLSSFLPIFSRINATVIRIWWRSTNNDTVESCFRMHLHKPGFNGWKTDSPKHAETQHRCLSLSIHTCLQKSIEICRDATVLLMLTIVCPTDTHLSTFYFHGFMPWMSEHTCLMGSLLFFFFWVCARDSEQWPNCWAATRLSPKDFLLNSGPPNTIWHATSRGGGGDAH